MHTTIAQLYGIDDVTGACALQLGSTAEAGVDLRYSMPNCAAVRCR